MRKIDRVVMYRIANPQFRLKAITGSNPVSSARGDAGIGNGPDCKSAVAFELGSSSLPHPTKINRKTDRMVL